MYFHVKNLLGDIINIVDSNGAVLVRYDYDVFGKITAIKNGNNQAITDTSSLAFLNPLRYRGYVYDDETGLYYLQSRYYDPVTGRFLNADIYLDTVSGSPLSTNMFAYCENFFILGIDASGMDALWIQSPISAYDMGHTSLLIEEKTDYWWYFYWSQESVQLFFLGKLKFNKIDNYVERFIIIFDREYDLDNRFDMNLEYLEEYTRKIRIKGNFTYSLYAIMDYMNCLSGNKFTIRFNPTVSSTSFIWLYYDTFRLNGHEHVYYKSKIRPLSMIVLNNKDYNLLLNNCMQKSIDFLLKGSFSQYAYYLRKSLPLLRKTTIPNIAYYGLSEFFSISSTRSPFATYKFVKDFVKSIDLIYSSLVSAAYYYVIKPLFIPF